MAYDILIKGGRIYDGSGLPSYLGDVAVQDGKIVETGRINGGAKRVVNADGLAVSPGFIDFHTHLDAQLLWDPLATSSCYHGVTTVIPGNCGLSLAPCKESDRDTILRSFERVEAITFPALKAGVPWGFTTFGQYLDAMRGNLGVNVASLVGHCALRQYVMGEASIERAATPAEIHQMKEVLKASIRAGAAGFSTNQNPVHMYADGTPIQSRFSTDEEIIAAMEQASCAYLLAKSPDGLDMLIGEMGTKLSGGEKQRLSIARALIRQPRLLIFDEATSALDSITEEQITSTVRQLSASSTRITLLIAHRLSTIMHANTIFVLEKGRIVESGTHAELLEAKGLYYAMWRQQIGERPSRHVSDD